MEGGRVFSDLVIVPTEIEGYRKENDIFCILNNLFTVEDSVEGRRDNLTCLTLKPLLAWYKGALVLLYS